MAESESTEKIMAESIKIVSESAEKMAESAKNMAESAKNVVENARNVAESARNVAESADKKVAESAKNVAESAKNVAESAKNVAESAKNVGESAKNVGESADKKVAESTDKSIAESANENMAESTKNMAESADKNMAESRDKNTAESTDFVDDYGLREACGLFGCVTKSDGPSAMDVASIIHLGLVGVQHRGQESAGIVTSTGDPSAKFCIQKHMGLVNTAFTDEDLDKLKGSLGIGHTRYSTQGSSSHVNIQPFVVETLHGLIAVAHNGELVKAKSLKKQLLLHGVGLSTGSDSELLTQLLTHQPECGEPDGANWLGRIQKMMETVSTSYSLLIMLPDRVYAVRDPFGNRPLCIGKLLPASAFTGKVQNKDIKDSELDGWVVSSESCSFNAVGAAYYREILPGEIVEISQEGIRSKMIVTLPKDKKPAFCFFEYVYFARPDSIFEGQTVHSVRKRCGIQLAKEAPVEADIVSTVPDSATPAAMEYARVLNIPFKEVLCKNTYVGRTFIQPTVRLRQLGVAKKFGPLPENFKGKRVVLIDDSIVRGNTMGSIVRLLKRFGAKEVHLRIASPPIKYPCYMGINIPTREELIANTKTIDEIRAFIGADSLHYLSIEGLLAAVQEGVDKSKPYGHCTACLNGQYPVTPEW